MLMYCGELRVLEYPGVVVRNGLLVKPMYIYVGEIERNLISGIIPLVRPVVLGSAGVVKVIEVFEKSTEYTGKTYTVSPLGDSGILGVDKDGLLASHISVDPSYIDEEVINPKPYDAIRPIINHAKGLVCKSSEPVLIEGCGLIGLITGLILRYMKVEPAFYCETGARSALSLGFHVSSHLSNLTKKWNTVILTSTEAHSKYRALTSLDYNRVVISRLSLTSWLPIRRAIIDVKVDVVGRHSYEVSTEGDYAKRVLNDIGSMVKIYHLNKLEDSIGLLPPRGLGSILVYSPNTMKGEEKTELN